MLLSKTKAAKMLHICPRTLDSMIKDNLIPVVKSEKMKHPKISTSAIENFGAVSAISKLKELRSESKEVFTNPFTNKKSNSARHKVA